MKLLVICGVYAEENEGQVLAQSRGYAEQSANIFQRKLIGGIEKSGIAYQVISAPLIGAYPKRYRKPFFRGFSNPRGNFRYVPFCNVWGIRNISRMMALKRAVKNYLRKQKEEIRILVYCPHTPFLGAALYAKKHYPNSKVCLVVPDLPQYMNLDEGSHRIYDFFKKYDIRYMQKLIDRVDSFILLTEPMGEVLNVGDRPHLVLEGLTDGGCYPPQPCSDGLKRIVYTGKLNFKFGIAALVRSFMKIRGEEYRLILCGDGDARQYVEEMAKVDGRIEYKGSVTAAQAQLYMQQADVLVNPRPNGEIYTKYSFPSKNIEYLLTGKPVVAYMLDGMPKIYEEFLYIVAPQAESFEDVILEACEAGVQKGDFLTYCAENLDAEKLILRMIKM